MVSIDLFYCSGSQLSLVWLVSTCDPELRVVPPGWDNPQRNQKPRRGWLSIPESSREARGAPCVRGSIRTASIPALSSGHQSTVSTSSSTAIQQGTQKWGQDSPWWGGQLIGIPKVRREKEGRPHNIPGASPALSLAPSLLVLPDPGVSPQRLFPSVLTLPPPSTSATPQGLGDPELNSGQDCATSVLREGWSEL